MNLPQNRWTVAYLASLPDDQLDRLGKKVAGHLTVGRIITGRVILAMQQTGLPARRGLSGALHYFILQGVHHVEARECRRVALKCESLPLLREAAETGCIGWTCLKEVVRKATPETEATWLDLCNRYTSRKIQQLVKHTREGESPLDPGGETPDCEAVEIDLRLTLPVEINALLAQVTREFSLRARRPLSLRGVLECLLAQHLTGKPFPDEAVGSKLTDQARRDVAAQRAAERREVEEIREEENSRESWAAPWAAVAAEEEPCPGEPELQIVRPAPAHWENERLRFNPEARHLTDAQRRELLRRDAYRCASPDCPHHVWLQVHHLVFYCDGGVTVPDNLLILCSTCHARIHKGRLRVKRLPNGALRWRDGRGRLLTGYRPAGWLEELGKLLLE